MCVNKIVSGTNRTGLQTINKSMLHLNHGNSNYFTQ